MKRLLTGLILAGAFAVGSLTSHAADWQPPGPIKLMIAFAAGGGADTQARLIAEELETSTGWKFIPENVTGKGGVNLLSAMKGMPNDGSVIGMAVTESLAYNLIAAKGSGLEPSDFTPLTTTAGFQMGVVAKTDSGYTDYADVVAAASDGKQIRFGVMSPRLADLAYLLGEATGVEFNLVSLKGGKAVMNALNAGDIDIGWGAGIQAKAVAAGDMVNLVSGISRPLDISPDAPLMSDLGVEFNADGYFMFVAPGGMDDSIRSTLSDALAGIAANPDTKAGALIARAFGGATVIKGAALDALVEADYDASMKLMEAAQ